MSAKAARLVADLRFRRRVQRFHPLGSRILAELLAQLCVGHDCQAEVERFLDRAVEYEDTICELGADQWPPLPLRVVS